MTTWVDKVQIYFPTFPFTATTSQQQIYFQLKCESQLSDALLLPFENTLLWGFQFVDETYRQYKGFIGRTQNILLGGFQVFNETHSQPDRLGFLTFFSEDFKFIKHSAEETHNKPYKGYIDMLTAQQQFVKNILLVIRFFEQKKVAQYDALVRSSKLPPEKPN